MSRPLVSTPDQVLSEQILQQHLECERVLQLKGSHYLPYRLVPRSLLTSTPARKQNSKAWFPLISV
jgi:hypothetical protein